jgi:hypothetical protein
MTPTTRMQGVVASDRPEAVDRRSGHVDGALVVPAEPLPAFGGTSADPDAEIGAPRVPGHERLREDRELRSRGRRIPCQARHAVERRLAVERDGRRLDD